MVKALGVSSSGYYQWKKSDSSKRQKENEALLVLIRQVYEAGLRKYGSPRIVAGLKELGYQVNHKRVARLMKENDISAQIKKRWKRPQNSSDSSFYAENLLNRQFQVSGKDEVWVSDITYLPTRSGWLYLSVILDLYSRKVVGWSMKNDLSSELVLDSLKMAYDNRLPKGEVLFHSDRGVQYTAGAVKERLKLYRFKQSMSRRGNCWDNACAESFFSSLKREGCVKIFENFNQARSRVFEYIEGFYNRTRYHSTLGYLSPNQFEKVSA